jgi:cytidine deaminase
MTIANEDLISAAKDARANAYNVYSNYRVGAAIIDDRGHLHAIAAMVQQGGKRIVKIAVVGGFEAVGPCTPCGGCRQRIHEFADGNTIILAIDDSNEWQEFSISELLPASFHLD